MGREPSERVDVCVVGAGPAGALAASTLASDGHDVVVLEAGPRFDFESRQRRMEEAIRPGHHGSVWEMGGERDAFSATGEQYYPLNVARVKGVGGGRPSYSAGTLPVYGQPCFEATARCGQ